MGGKNAENFEAKEKWGMTQTGANRGQRTIYTVTQTGSENNLH